MNRCCLPLLLGLGLIVPAFVGPSGQAGKPAGKGHSWPMFGGTPARNLVNTVEKNMPTDWSVEEGKFKNIKWSAALGGRAYGGVVVAGGRVYVGTNNEEPRDPKVKGPKGV